MAVITIGKYRKAYIVSMFCCMQLFCVEPDSFKRTTEMPASLDKRSFKKEDSKPIIAVIGAGLSGLAMAYRLQQKGYPVVVYEARSRVGGRVHTVYVKTLEGTYSLAELGGQNITDGGEAPHFLNLAAELGLEIEEDRRYVVRASYMDEKIHTLVELLKAHCALEDLSKERIGTLAQEAHSIADILERLFVRNPLLKRTFDYYMGAYEGLHPKDLAVFHNQGTLEQFIDKGAMAPQEKEGIEEPFLLKYIKGGNSNFPLALAEKLAGKVFLDKVLLEARLSDQGIVLYFSDHTSVVCDKLIVSIPCTVFKDICWDPLLIPQEKLEAFKKVQYGANGKIMVPSRPKTSDILINADHVGVFHNNDNKLLTLYTDSVWGKKLNIDLKKYYPFMLEMLELAYGTFQHIPLFPQEISDSLYERYDNPIVKSWGEDPYAQGSYTAVGTLLGADFLESSPFKHSMVKTLFAPLEDRVFFIGEHTSLIEEIGTMEAAIESAERASKLF